MKLSSLEAWYQAYIAEDDNATGVDSAVVQAVKSDYLDDDLVNSRVQSLRATACVEQGFCHQCKHLLEHWPSLPRDVLRAHRIVRVLETEEVEAAALEGCRFCTFIFYRLNFQGLLRTFRRIEARLRRLGLPATASLAVQNWTELDFTPQLLWINFPGKSASEYGSPGAESSHFESHVISPLCTLKAITTRA
ncbi:uncharacterized protein B0I36DRAFT_337551 [Microdochium trichocladiopsis]|uniref:Uncharacterized protein n=1 Tax=Microdochium trichocladiopsis TaxID=1682393 RepID=A0A9P8XWJ1_9PEZI|nr:uncharacterized protein B0I36DRAFT_337551 [Microdochium trichocladiopsis]KAH7016386.1 hypothetical protein B0I36DRAFT_337551 [Microdochium trichocladiopsis]